MAANKAQLDQILSNATGVPLTETAKVTSALPDSLGKWLKENGAGAPGTFAGEASGLQLSMTRAAAPTPHWSLKIDGTNTFLDDYGDTAARFGLAVENA